MCTSFIYRGHDTIIGMNFDNNGMNYSINTSTPGQFTVLVDGGRGKYPSFGVANNGLFANNLVVDSNGKGLYRRPSKKVTHTTKLLTDILNGNIPEENIDIYLKNIEVVNTPDWSCHNMICDSNGNVWIVEPGRGNLYSSRTSSPYFVMTNFSLWDYMHENTYCNCSRYHTVTDELSKISAMNIDEAFRILELAKQNDNEWNTAFSMVYSKLDNTVHYCVDGDFSKKHEYRFPTW